MSELARDNHEEVRDWLSNKEVALVALSMIDNALELGVSPTGNPAHTELFKRGGERARQAYIGRAAVIEKALAGSIPSIEELDEDPSYTGLKPLGYDISHILRLAPPIVERLHAAGITLDSVGDNGFREHARREHKTALQEAHHKYSR